MLYGWREDWTARLWDFGGGKGKMFMLLIKYLAAANLCLIGWRVFRNDTIDSSWFYVDSEFGVICVSDYRDIKKVCFIILSKFCSEC
jgi:hypothetical protein